MMQRAPLIPRPGVRFGRYPERTQQRAPWSSYLAEMWRAKLLAVRTPSARAKARFLAEVHARRAALQGCDTEFVKAAVKRLRSRLVVDGMQFELVAEGFALIDACMHAHLGFRLHDTQLQAAWMMLDRRLVEMQTGEGKTLAVALAAATGALAGIPVHVVTANDYLVARDAESLQPVFQMLGLSVGAITSDLLPEDRPSVYLSDITYCTAKELAFDYLRDQLAQADNGKRNLRGLCMAIVDEADSVLIDEARMPLILSDRAANAGQSAFYRQALFLSAQLKFGEDFELDHAHRRATLTGAGRQRAEALASRMGGSWTARRRREEMLCLALAARHLFLNHHHYLVRDDEVVIIDETTGRAAPGRVWSQGLHQLIELKENCEPTEEQRTVAQTTFQRFFSRYLRLSGISGTVLESKGELLAIYGLPVASVPLQCVSRRQHFPDRVFVDREARWSHVVERVQLMREQGRPVLIGTDSVGESETLSALLTQAGIEHAVLNARFDAEEAQIVAQAGQKGAVTVSTNMAGRGTDIRLGEGVAALGGMHVIACQTNDSTRIDRQLHGRCGRQGEPGSVEHLHCLEHGFQPFAAQIALLTRCLRLSGERRELPAWFARLARVAQKMRSRSRRREQWLLFLRDKQMDRHLAFAGPQE